MIAASDIKARFPGAFDAMSDDFLSLLIAEATEEIDEGRWGDRYDRGLLYYAAYLASTSPAPGGGAGAVAAGPLISKRVGDVSWTYANTASAANSSVAYGPAYFWKMFEDMRDIVQGGPVTAVMDVAVSYDE